MGMFSKMSNKKKTSLSRNHNKLKRLKRAERKKRDGVVEGDIKDKDLITTHHLRKRRTNPRANITLSGKKRKKLEKQLLRQAREKSAMDIDTQTHKPQSTEESSKNKSKKKDIVQSHTMEVDQHS